MNTSEIKNIFGAAVDFVLNPGKAFSGIENNTTKEALKHMLLLSLIASLLGTGITYLSALEYLSGASAPVFFSEGWTVFLPGLFIASYVLINVGLVLASLWLHLWVLIFGGRGDIRETMKSVFYGWTPAYVLGWIPAVNIITYLWSTVLTGMGLTRLQKMTPRRAAGSIIISALIPVLFLISIFVYVIYPMLSLPL